jgi:hypothetical protein
MDSCDPWNGGLDAEMNKYKTVKCSLYDKGVSSRLHAVVRFKPFTQEI